MLENNIYSAVTYISGTVLGYYISTYDGHFASSVTQPRQVMDKPGAFIWLPCFINCVLCTFGKIYRKKAAQIIPLIGLVVARIRYPLNLASLIKSIVSFYSVTERLIYVKFKLYLASFINVIITHIFREENTAADWVAKHEFSIQSSLVWDRIPHRELLHIITTDSLGRTLERRAS